MKAILSYHKYKYYPYEYDLAEREIRSLLGTQPINTQKDSVELVDIDPSKVDRLTYFSQVCHNDVTSPTKQFLLESSETRHRRQSTRYSVHGLHEYKGKFNPQIAKSLLNICGMDSGCRVLYPFCGSGTTLVEAVQMGANAQGYDINPFAIFVSNSKLQALKTDAEFLRQIFQSIQDHYFSTVRRKLVEDERIIYLKKWFNTENLIDIECLKNSINKKAGGHSQIFLTIASNLLRDYSMQDPKDLRIRRRKSPLPDKSIIDAFIEECERFLSRLVAAQEVIGKGIGQGQASLTDTSLSQPTNRFLFDAAITSPPYAMALPYIDTQRLSLVWLGIENSQNIAELESTLIGSRELRGVRKEAERRLIENTHNIPTEQLELCRSTMAALSSADGFRRQAVPTLLYRYFAAMQASFKSIISQIKVGGKYYLVVGHNHTVLGGQRFDIDTPTHLASLARNTGWIVDEMIPLQTYQRWGYHSANAVAAETLVSLSRP